MFEGCGVLLIGVTAGELEGVDPVDLADFEPLLTHFLGVDGPRWQPTWVQVDGRHVLAVVIAAPKPGDLVHSFRNVAGKIVAGQVYVRRGSRSEPARHDDYQRLARRAVPAPSPAALNVRFGAIWDSVLPRLDVNHELRDAFIEAERVRLQVSDMDRPKRSGFHATVGDFPDRRTKDEFENQVTTYLAAVAESWDEAVAEHAASVLPLPSFTLFNESERNYAQVEVKVHVAGAAWTFRTRRQRHFLRDLLPTAPLAWGRDNILRNVGLTGWHSDVVAAQPTPQTVGENHGSFTLQFPPAGLRPMASIVLEDEWAVVIPVHRPDPVIVRWHATATNVDAVARGEFEIATDDRITILEPALGPHPD